MNNPATEHQAHKTDAANRNHRARRARIAGAAAVGLAAAVAIAVIASRGGGEAPQLSDGSFGPHHAGLEQRRLQAGVSTMGSPTANVHTHPVLSVLVEGKQVEVPANIGIDPSKPPDEMAGLHTHTPDGIIHNEGQAAATLGKFFAVWGVPFSANRLGPYRTSKNEAVQMWVDGKPSGLFGALRLEDKQRIVVSFGRPSARSPGN